MLKSVSFLNPKFMSHYPAVLLHVDPGDRMSSNPLCLLMVWCSFHFSMQKDDTQNHSNAQIPKHTLSLHCIHAVPWALGGEMLYSTCISGHVPWFHERLGDALVIYISWVGRVSTSLSFLSLLISLIKPSFIEHLLNARSRNGPG